MSTPDASQFNSSNAWMQNFGNGNSNNDDKNNDYWVRPVRT